MARKNKRYKNKINPCRAIRNILKESIVNIDKDITSYDKKDGTYSCYFSGTATYINEKIKFIIRNDKIVVNYRMSNGRAFCIVENYHSMAQLRRIICNSTLMFEAFITS